MSVTLIYINDKCLSARVNRETAVRADIFVQTQMQLQRARAGKWVRDETLGGTPWRGMAEHAFSGPFDSRSLALAQGDNRRRLLFPA